MKKHYTLLDHTADLRIRITGDDPAELFRNAGLALFDLIGDPQSVVPEAAIALEASGEDRADLMVNFLRELLYLWTGGEKLVKMIDIRDISATAVSARVTIGSYVPGSHAIAREIKAVTYHQIEVSCTPAGWQATVVLDI